MIKEEDIKVGKIFCISRQKLEQIANAAWVKSLYEDIQLVYTIKIIDMVDGRCEIKPIEQESTIDVSVKELARLLPGCVGDFRESIEKKHKTEQVSHPSHYSWLKDLCGIEPIDVCRHFDFAVGNALKYLMRKGKVDGDKTEKEKRIEDLKKAVFYLQDEINRLKDGKM